VTKPVLIILHQEHSTPGRVGYALRQRGFTLDLRRPPLGEALPNNLKDYSGVVIFGGPMSANDPDAFIGEEIKLIERTLKAETPFLGLCLGAQLLCRAMGTRVYKHPEEETEIGYYPLRPTKAGEEWATSHGARWPRAVYHWHREGFDLPKGAELLAEGEAFLHQAFRIGQKTLALQFHPEVTYAMICRWTTNIVKDGLNMITMSSNGLTPSSMDGSVIQIDQMRPLDRWPGTYSTTPIKGSWR